MDAEVAIVMATMDAIDARFAIGAVDAHITIMMAAIDTMGAMDAVDARIAIVVMSFLVTGFSQHSIPLPPS